MNYPQVEEAESRRLLAALKRLRGEYRLSAGERGSMMFQGASALIFGTAMLFIFIRSENFDSSLPGVGLLLLLSAPVAFLLREVPIHHVVRRTR